MTAKRRFQLVLIKPSHYDDDGYVIRWWRAMIPSNSLAAVYGIAADCAERQVLGPDVVIDIEVIDETNTRIDVPTLLARFRSHSNFGLVALTGVQSNQYPRALDIARPFRDAGIQVAMGGFHVSGCLSMLDGRAVDLDTCRDMGIAMFAGEAEDRLDTVLRDAADGRLAPLYDFMKDLPRIEGTPVPFLPKRYVARTLGLSASFDAGRGCPYQCSFCTIINVQGRKSRRRTPDDVEKIIRANWEQGLFRYFITDDNFARNKDWEAILDRMIYLREQEKMDISFLIQIDTLAYKVPNFIAKCARAGVKKVYIGLENINPANLMAAKKKQNKITEYRAMLLAWQKAGILCYAGYLTGFPADTAESILHDIDVLKRELPIDVLEIFYLTPLPGSEDHQKLFRAGIWMDPDLNKYDLYHITQQHPKMTKAEWEYAYHDAWRRYYSYEHCETIMRRAASMRAFGSNLVSITWFKGCIEIENVHPVEGGIFRMKSRRDRRSTLPMEPVWKCYPSYWTESIVKGVRWGWTYARLRKIYLSIKHDPKRYEYVDAAIEPVTEAEIETHEMFKSEAAQAYVSQEQRLANIREKPGEKVAEKQVA